MAKARADIVAQAFRRLGILAVDEPLTADMAAHGVATYDALVAELSADGLFLAASASALAVDTGLTWDGEGPGGGSLGGLSWDGETGSAADMPWAADAVPDGFAVPLAALLSTELAMYYDVAPRDTRARCIARLRSILLPDDRPVITEYADDYGRLVVTVSGGFTPPSITWDLD